MGDSQKGVNQELDMNCNRIKIQHNFTHHNTIKCNSAKI